MHLCRRGNTSADQWCQWWFLCTGLGDHHNLGLIYDWSINGACSITSLRAFHVQHVATCLVATDNKAARTLCTQGIRPAVLSQSGDGCSHPRGPRDLKCLDKGVESPRHFDSRSGTEISGTVAAWSRWILVLPKCETVLWKGHALMFFSKKVWFEWSRKITHSSSSSLSSSSSSSSSKW